LGLCKTNKKYDGYKQKSIFVLLIMATQEDAGIKMGENPQQRPPRDTI